MNLLIILRIQNIQNKKISTYSKYVDKPEYVLEFIEYNKNIPANVGTLRKTSLSDKNPMEVTKAGIIIYNVLPTIPGDTLDH